MIRSFRTSAYSALVSGKRRLASFAKFDQVLVDSFTAKPFSGNPAAVVFQQRSGSWMQSVASENNIPVTAFLSRESPEIANSFNIRWLVFFIFQLWNHFHLLMTLTHKFLQVYSHKRNLSVWTCNISSITRLVRSSAGSIKCEYSLPLSLQRIFHEHNCSRQGDTNGFSSDTNCRS